MADVYVYSGAAGAGTGADWTNAYTTIGAAFAAKAAGDDFWVADDHSEQGGVLTLSCPGTIGAPCRVICVNRGGTVPPVSADLRTTAVIGTTGTAALVWTASATTNYFYCYGIIWKTGSVGNAASQTWAVNKVVLENCSFQLNTTNTSTGFLLGGTTASPDFTTINCTWVFGSASQAINLRGGRVRIIGGSIAATGTLPTNVIATTTGTAISTSVILDGVDLSSLTNKTIIGAQLTDSNIQLINCKMQSGYTLATVPTGNQINDLIISDSGTLNYRMERTMYGGPLTTEISIIRSGGATDGTTPISWKIVTNANAKLQIPVECFQIAIWNTSTGSSKTATIEIANNGTTLTNNDVWVEVEYLSSTATPISTMVSNAPTDVLTAASNLPTSSATWNNAGGFTLQYLQVTFTPQMVGYVRAVVKIAKASKTIYVDPVITVA